MSFAVLGLLIFGGVSTTVAAPVDIPNRKPGLWEMKMTRAGSASPHMVTQNCVGEISDKRNVADWTKPIEGCSKNNTQRIATGYIRDSICTVGGMTITSHMEITGDFDSTYTVKTTVHNEGGPPTIPREAVTILVAKWLGACKTDQKPGDLVRPATAR